MKKVFLFLAIFMLSLSGALFACGGGDKYANLKVELVSVVNKSTGEALSYDSESNCYQVMYGENFIVSAKVNSDAVASKRLQFNSSDSLTAKNISDTSAEVSASSPSGSQTFKLTVSSIEVLNRGSLDLYFKVLLPVTEISFVSSDNLGVLAGQSISLTDNLQFASSYSSAFEFEESEKQVDFSLDSYVDSDGAISTFSKVEDGVYYVSDKPCFEIEKNETTGKYSLIVLDTSLSGKVNVTAKSSKYVENDDSEANQKLKASTSINIVAPLTYNDISVSSNQTSFNVMGQNNKFDFVLFTYPGAEYKVGTASYSYSLEQIKVAVNSQESITIEPLFDSIIEKREQQNEENSATFVFGAKNTGVAHLDFKIKFNFTNDVEYLFSDLLGEYKDANSDTTLNDVKDFTVNVYSLATSVKVLQDGKNIENNSSVVYDSYSNDKGTRFDIDLGDMSKSPECDRTVRVQIVSDVVTSNLSEYFVFTDTNGKPISVTSSEGKYYFDRDISKEDERTFYAKAVSDKISDSSDSNKFSFVFENIVNSELKLANGNTVSPSSDNNGLSGQKKTISFETKKGVTTIVASTVIVENGSSTFYNLTEKDKTSYNELVLEAGNTSGSLVAYFYDNNLSDNIKFASGSNIVEIKALANASSYFDGINNNLKLGGVLQVSGLAVGKTTITFTAPNGISNSINVVVVGFQMVRNSLKLEKVNNETKLTENDINDETNPCASVVKGGKLSLSLEGNGKILGDVEYTSEKSDIASIKNGIITANEQGTTTISATVKYYDFFQMSNNYIGWRVKTATLTFTLNVFIPGNVSLRQKEARIYDVDSVPYNLRDNATATFEFKIEFGNTSSTLYNEMASRIKFVLVNQSDISYITLDNNSFNNYTVYGDILKGTVSLGEYKDEATIFIKVHIDEFGLYQSPIDCKIVVTKANQVKSIGINATTVVDNVTTKVDVAEKSSYDEIRVHDNSTINLNAVLTGKIANETIRDKSLFAYITNGESDEKDTANKYATLSKGTTSGYSLDLAGEETFNLAVKDGGIFYLVLIAKDSYVSNTTYKVYKKIRVVVEDGEKQAYSIKTASQLSAISNAPTKNYQLVNDISLGGNYAWTPISSFSGVLNGNGYTIDGLSLSSAVDGKVGLFSEIAKNDKTYGAVYNLKIKNATISINSNNQVSNVGIVAGINNGFIINVVVEYITIESKTKSDVKLGSFAGQNNGTILCYGVDLSSDNDEARNTKYFSNLNYFSDKEKDYTSTTYSTGTSIVVTSSETSYVGGLVGENKGTIDGNYKASTQSSSKVNFISYNQRDVDVVAYINVRGGAITNEESAIGGIAGVNYGTISNFAIEGNIGSFNTSTNKSNTFTCNNVGGVAGKLLTKNAKISNILTSIKVAGNNYVGGVVGYASAENGTSTDLANIFNARVENHDLYSDGGYSPMIVGNDYVGGVVGYAELLLLQNSYSYGFTSKSNQLYVSKGDIFIYGDEAHAGGLVGDGTNINLSNVFSTFNIISLKNSSYVKGLVGGNTENASAHVITLLNDVFYIGVVSVDFSASASELDLLGVSGTKYYYLLKYGTLNNTNILEKRFVGDATSPKEDATPNILIEYYDGDNSVIIKKHTSLLADIPSDISVVGLGGEVSANNQIVFGQNYYHYENGDKKVIILTYGENSRFYNLADIFSVTTTSSVTNINLVVSTLTSNGVARVTDSGELELLKVGVETLKFALKESSNICGEITVVVVEDFDKLLLSQNGSLQDSYWDYNYSSNQKSVASNQFVNFNYALVDENNEEISNYTNYAVDFTLYYKETSAEYKDVTNDTQYIVKESKRIKFVKEGSYKLVATVRFTIDDTDYCYTSENWVSFLKAEVNVVEIGFSMSEIRLSGYLNTTKTFDAYVYVGNTTTTVQNLSISIAKDGSSEASEMVARKYGDDANTFIYENVSSPFSIILTKPEETVDGDNTFWYSMKLVLKSEAYNVTDVSKYIVSCSAQNKSSDFTVVVSPSELSSIEYSYYTYTKEASKLVKASEPNEGSTTFYSYVTNASSTLVSGMGGLLVVDLVPYYANEMSVTIESSVKGSKELSFVQLLKVNGDKGDNNSYYIAGPSTTTNADGSVNLQLVSTLKDAYLDYKTGILHGDAYSYSFGEDGGVGRLYIRVVAPSSLEAGDSIDIIVKVSYMGFTSSSGKYAERKSTTTIPLRVVEAPTATLTISHDGTSRNIIAYTATGIENEETTADYLAITPKVQTGYKYYLSYNYISGGKEKGESSDYATLENGLLKLGKNAKVGDTIKIRLTVEISTGDDVINQVLEQTVTVVDAVVTKVSINGLDDNNVFNMTISSSKQLQVSLEGYGTKSSLSAIEKNISRAVLANKYSSLSDNADIPYYWFIENPTIDGEYRNLNVASELNNVPFSVKQLSATADSDTFVATADLLGASGSTINYTIDYNTIYLEGLINAGSANLRMKFSYVYNEGKLQLIPLDESLTSIYVAKIDFTVNVVAGDDETDLIAVSTQEEFMKMANAQNGQGNYILVNDLTLDTYSPIDANFASFDGNNKVITINSFYLPDSRTTQSVNFGLFGKISSSSIVKNVIVALPNSKTGVGGTSNTQQYMTQLNSYTTINYGGLAGVNEGIITNCDVIATTSTVSNGYVINAYTNNTVSRDSINVGGFVGTNSGIITNSRVGRKDVYVLKTSYIGSVVATKEKLSDVTNFTMALYGAGNVGGFVATNSGTISSSYADNLQIEVFSSANGTQNIRTAGFVVNNTGYIYGSYASGIEENDAQNVNSRKLGGGIFSNGCASGFVFSNTNYIADCYSNINLTGSYDYAIKTARVNDSSANSLPGVAGFVYIKGETSYIKTSYSLSKISNKNTYGPFESTIASPGDNSSKKQLGTIENCYYLLEDGQGEELYTKDERAQKLSDNAIVDGVSTSSARSGVNQFTLTDSFNGFSFDPEIEDLSLSSGNGSGGVWAIRMEKDGINGYPDLVSANTIAISSRIKNTTKSSGGDVTVYFTYVVDYELGSLNNPYIISTAEQYNKIFREYKNNLQLENSSSKYVFNVRLINNIDFNNDNIESTTVEFTSITGQTAIFDGNYLAMTNINLNDNASNSYAFGLFKDIYRAGVKNLTLGVTNISATDTTAVGALAGVIVDSNISNVTLVPSSNQEGLVFGKNYVGALAGIITSSDPNSRSSVDKDKLYYVSNIYSTLSIKGNTDKNSATLVKDFSIWSKIAPLTQSGNLRLSGLKSDTCSYAGGIAGVVDLRQETLTSSTAVISKEVVHNVHVGEFKKNSKNITDTSFNKDVAIISNYVGGLFGLIGSQTMVARSEFIVGSGSLLSAKLVAGGVAGFNYGMVNKTYVSYNKTYDQSMEKALKEYVEGGSSRGQININLYNDSTDATPTYIGGLVGINAGSSVNGSGSIIDSYNRVDVRNSHATAVGGIVGGSYVGELRNVYTNASLLGDTTNKDTKIGGIIGKIFDNPIDGLFESITSGNKTLTLSNIVALNIYEKTDFDDLYAFVNDENTAGKKGKLGALYGEYTNADASKGQGIVRIEQSSKVYFNQYALRQFDATELNKGKDETFVSSTYPQNNLIELWGTAKSGANYDEYLSGYLEGEVYYLIQPHQLYRFIQNETDDGTFLRDKYFGPLKWSRDVWSYNEEQVLPTLQYGMQTNVRRIYTAEEFMEEVSSSNNAEMTYLIMNDLDFSTVGDITPISKTFGGRIVGNTIEYTDTDGNKYSRYPILFNLKFNVDNSEVTSYALFEHASNATFSNFSIVVDSYKVTFKNGLDASTKASVLVALAEGVTVSNVSIYSSLMGMVSKYPSNVKEHEITKGTRTVTTEKTSTTFVGETAFLVTRYKQAKTVNSTEIDETRVYTYNNSKFTIASVVSNYEGGTPTDTSKIASITTAVSQVETNAEYFGGLMASTGESSVVIQSCSTNLDVKITTTQKSNSIYYGTLVGEGNGKIRNSVAMGENGTKIYITSDYQSDSESYKDAENLYVGGVAGYFKGEIEGVYVDNLTIKVGNDSKAFIVNNPNTNSTGGAYIGGLVGTASSYSASKSYTSGNIDNVYIDNISIETNVKGQLTVGGAVGRNIASIENVFIRNRAKVVGSAFDARIVANVDNNGSKTIIGGVVGDNTSSSLNNVYSNLPIKVNAISFASLYVGGIIGQTSSTMSLTNILSDAKEIRIEKTTDKDGYSSLGYLVVGGVVASATSLELRTVLTAVDIVASQEGQMYIGGAVGYADSLAITNVIVLGNILLLRGKGVDSNSYFYNDDSFVYCVGGLVGSIQKSFNVLSDSGNQSNLILSTIRDYAVGQKLVTYESSVIGGKHSDVNFSGSLARVYFNENISLVSNDNITNATCEPNSVDSFSSIGQGVELKNLLNDMLNVDFNATSNSLDFIKYVEGTETIFFNNYRSGSSTTEFVVGSKINPVSYAGGSLLQDTYYVLNSDLYLDNTISTSISETIDGETVVSSYAGWVLNCQGYSINIGKNSSKQTSVFDTITENSAVVGLLVDITSNFASESAVITKNNYGFIFSCGVSGSTEKSGDAPSSIASIAYNNYGVIARTFSTADLYSDAGYGLVVFNGKVDNAGLVGNIYDSYYTGAIIDGAKTSGSYFGGIAYKSVYGVISNSYTMADIEAYQSKSIYPIVCNNLKDEKEQKANLYRTYYDYIAYTGDFEGTDSTGTVWTKCIADVEDNNASYITAGGIYAWTTTFSGDVELKNSYIKKTNITNVSDKTVVLSAVTKTILDLFQTSWVGQANKQILVDTFNTKVYTSEQVAERNNVSLNLDNTWFNYGYVSKDLKRVYADENTTKYFTMIYTGNGRNNKENLESPNPTSTIDGFVDMPYNIKHGGLLDMLVTENCLQDELNYRHYLFTRNISLKKYKKLTYWSESWDTYDAMFIGDLDGGNKLVSDMFATYGLVRAIPNESLSTKDGKVTRVRDIVFNGCYSKTGLVAGYIASGEITGIKVADKYDVANVSPNYVYNGDLFSTLAEGHNGTLETYTSQMNADAKKILQNPITSIKLNDKIEGEADDGKSFANNRVNLSLSLTNGKAIFAGGLVGFMEGGLISNVEIDGLNVMAYNRITERKNLNNSLDGTTAGDKIYNDDITYIGGIVGIMTGGTITTNDPNSDTDDTRSVDESGDEVTTNINNYGDIIFKKMIVAPSFDDQYYLQPFSYVGGVVGYIGGSKQTPIIDGVSLKTTNKSSEGEQEKNKISLYGIMNLGGIAGISNGSALIKNCTYDLNDSKGEQNKFRLGYGNWEYEDSVKLVYSDLSDEIVDHDKWEENVISNTSKDKEIEYNWHEVTFFVQDVYLGGIVGSIYKGTLENCSFGTNANVDVDVKKLSGYGTIIFGGIAGEMYQDDDMGEINITNSSIYGDMTIKSSLETIVGGVVGRMRGGILQQFAIGQSGKDSIIKASASDVNKSGNLDLSATLPDYKNSNIANAFNKYIETVTKEWKDASSAKEYPKALYSAFTQLSNMSGEDYWSVKGSAIATAGISRFAQYSSVGGVVGKLLKGDLEGTNSTFGRVNVISNESAGGVVGRVYQSASSYGVTIKDFTLPKTINVYAGGIVSFTIGGKAVFESEVSSVLSYDSLTKYFANTDGLVNLSGSELYVWLGLGLSKSSAGGVVGTVNYLLNNTSDKEFVRIENCSTNGGVGSAFATYSGGIVGLVSETTSTNTHTVITGCTASAILRGYILKSFAGGIVGYLNHGTVYNCTFAGSFGNLFSNLGQIFSSNSDDASTVVSFLSKLADVVLGVPNISGGIVGYCEMGEVRASNTKSFTNTSGGFSFDISLIIGYRVAGGIVGVATGGLFTPQKWKDNVVGGEAEFGVMSNNGIVYSLAGISGGLFGVVCGGNDTQIVGYQIPDYSISEAVVKIIASIVNSFDEKNEATFFDLLKEKLGLSDDTGLLINNYFGIVMGQIAGGIVGYFDTNSVDKTYLSGCFNFGRVYTNLMSMFTAFSVMKSMTSMSTNLSDTTKLDNTQAIITFMAKLSKSGYASDGVLSEWFNKIDMGFDEIDEMLTTIDDAFTFSASLGAGILIDGKKYPIVDIGLSANGSLLNIDLGGLTDADIVSNIEFYDDVISAISGITVYKYHHDPYWKPTSFIYDSSKKNQAEVISYGLTRAEKMICKIVQEEPSETEEKLKEEKSLGLIVFNDYYPDGATASNGEVIWQEPTDKGFGASGGIVGMTHGSGKLVISLSMGYTLTLPSVLSAVASSVVFSNGMAGGIVGLADSPLLVTSTFNYLNVVGRVAGGIVGYANKEVTVSSYRENPTLVGEFKELMTTIMQEMLCKDKEGTTKTSKVKYGPVMNSGIVNGSIFAGGIYGYSNGGKINTKEMEEFFFREHTLGLYAEGNWNENEFEVSWDDALSFSIEGLGDLSIFTVTNSGSVISDRFAGGIAGYVEGDSAFYNAKVTASWLSSLGDTSSLFNTKLSDIADSIINKPAIHISAPYAGGIVGHLGSGVIGGSCSAGYSSSFGVKFVDNILEWFNNVKDIRISAYFYSTESIIPTEVLTDSSKKEYFDNLRKNYNAGGYAGGVVGLMTGGQLGTKFENSNQSIAVTVLKSIKFGYNDSFTVPYVGGAIGCYAVPESKTNVGGSIGGVSVKTTVSNGFFTGGLLGRLLGNDSKDSFTFGLGTSSTPYIVGQVNEYNKSGELQTEDSDRLIIEAKTGTICGGIIGYLCNGNLSNIISSVKVEGQKGTTVGGVVGWLNGGTITNCVATQLKVEELEYKVEEKKENSDSSSETSSVSFATATANSDDTTKKVSKLTVDWDTKDKDGNPVYLFEVSNSTIDNEEALEKASSALTNSIKGDADEEYIKQNFFDNGKLITARLFADSYVGGIAGRISSNSTYGNSTYIKKCAMYADIYGGTNVGGIVGHVLGKVDVQECYSFGDIIRAGNAGGIVGVAQTHKSGRTANLRSESPVISSVYVGREILVEDTLLKTGGVFLAKLAYGDDATLVSEKLFNFDTTNKILSMFDETLVVFAFGDVDTDNINTNTIKEYFEDNLTTISGSMSVGGFVGVLDGYSTLESGKAGIGVQVKTEIDSKNKLETAKQMIYAVYGNKESVSTIARLCGEDNVAGIGAVGGSVGIAKDHAQIGMDATTTSSFWSKVEKTLQKMGVGLSQKSEDGYLQSAGIVNGWTAGGLVGKMMDDATVLSGTTGLYVRGEIYAGGAIGSMIGGEISGISNYSIFNVETNGVFALDGTTLKLIDNVTGDGTEGDADEDGGTDFISELVKDGVLKTSLGGVVGYYNGEGNIKYIGARPLTDTTTSGFSPMPVFGLGLNIALSVVSDKYYAGGIIGHLENGNFTNATITNLSIGAVAGNISYAGSIIGRVSGTSTIEINVKEFDKLFDFSTLLVQAIKGAGDVIGAVTKGESETTVTLKIDQGLGANVTALMVGGAVGAVLDGAELKLESSFKAVSTLNGTVIGGVAGYVAGTLNGSDKIVTAKEKIFDGKNNTIGGVVGLVGAGGTVKDVTNEIKIVAGHKATVGGIAGEMAGGTIENCINNANLTLKRVFKEGTDDTQEISATPGASNPWNGTEKTDTTNAKKLGDDNKTLKTVASYKEFCDEGYDEGSIGGIVGSAVTESALDIAMDINVSDVADLLSKRGSVIRKSENKAQVYGYYYYGRDTVGEDGEGDGSVEEHSFGEDDKAYINHIADKRGTLAGSVSAIYGSIKVAQSEDGKTKIVPVLEFKDCDLPENKGIGGLADLFDDEEVDDENTDTEYNSGIDYKKLGNFIVDLLTVSKSEIKDKLVEKLKDYANVVPEYADDWVERNKEAKEKKQEEQKAYMIGYYVQAKTVTTNDKGETTTTYKTYCRLKPSTTNEIEAVSDVKTMLNSSGYTKASFPADRSAPSSSNALITYTKIKAVVKESLKNTEAGIYQLEIPTDYQEKSMGSFTDGDTTYTVTGITFNLNTASIVIGDTYNELQACGGDIQMSRNALSKKGFTSELGVKTLLYKFLYHLNDEWITIVELLNQDFKINGQLV